MKTVTGKTLAVLMLTILAVGGVMAMPMESHAGKDLPAPTSWQKDM